MNRATIAYLLMFVAAAAVLWMILRVGSRLKAPPDLSGEWKVLEPALPPRTVEIQQSGVYFHLNVPGEPRTAYKMHRDGDQRVLHSAGGRRVVQLERGPNDSKLTLIDPDSQHPPIRLWRDKADRPFAKVKHGSAH